MLLLLTAVDQFPQLDLNPVHHLIASLYFTQGFLLIGLDEHMNQLLNLLVLPFVLFFSIASEVFQIVFYFISEIDSILLHQFFVGKMVLVHSSMIVIASRKKGIYS